MNNPEMLVLVAERKDGSGGFVGYLYAGMEPESFRELRARALLSCLPSTAVSCRAQSSARLNTAFS